MGLPGIVDLTTRPAAQRAQRARPRRLEVGAELSRAPAGAAFAENDANAAALAEAWLGAGRGARTVLYVTLGTGVGGGLVFDGRIWSGRNGYAGEIGHTQVAARRSFPCGCGSWGCLETIAGIGGWTRRAEARSSPGRPAARAPHADSPRRSSSNERRAGDEVALEVVDAAARAVAVGVAGALTC